MNPPLLTLLALTLLLTACASTPPATTSPPAPTAPPATAPLYISMQTTKGEIILELDTAHAPITTTNFLLHADRGDYNGTCFHRVIPIFVIQGGGWVVDYTCLPAATNPPRAFTLTERAKADEAAGRKDVPIKNEWTNGLKNTRGTIAMARDTLPDTATREFYINVADNAKLDTAREKAGNAGYAVFGRVISGMDVVDAIKDGKTTDRPDIIVDGEGMKDVPINPVIILSVTVIPAPR